MTPLELQERNFEAYQQFLLNKRVGIAPSLGKEATNLVLSPFFALGIPEAAQPRADYEPKPVNAAAPRELGAEALATVTDITKFRDRHSLPTVTQAVEHALAA